MAAVTTGQLLLAVEQACHRSSLVDSVDVQAVDADTLSVRILLTQAGVFVNVFYNLATDKTAFALVDGQRRVYGADNAKMGWHMHPFETPAEHVACAPMGFEQFLAEVEAHYASWC